MADTVIVSTTYLSSDPGHYWFSIAIDNGITHDPIVLTAASAVLVEIQQGPNSWFSAALDVAPFPLDPGFYWIRTVVPAALANGQERVFRLTIDGVVYGPWTWRFYGGGG